MYCFSGWGRLKFNSQVGWQMCLGAQFGIALVPCNLTFLGFGVL
jgi:hypothetical protein